MKIFGIGMNYRCHADEMKEIAPGREANQLEIYDEPVVFTKCDSALVTRGRPFFIPDYTNECEYEAELVVRICRMGRFIGSMFLVPQEGGLSAGNYVVDGILAVLMVIILLRAFSRNIVKRRQECDKWSTFWWRFRTGNVDKQFTNGNAFKYVTCERCSTTSRVPAGKGKIIVICPKCQTHIPTET